MYARVQIFRLHATDTRLALDDPPLAAHDGGYGGLSPSNVSATSSSWLPAYSRSVHDFHVLIVSVAEAEGVLGLSQNDSPNRAHTSRAGG